MLECHTQNLRELEEIKITEVVGGKCHKKYRHGYGF